MRVRILQQLNGAHGTFLAGDIAELPEDVAAAWVEAGIAELPVVTAADGRKPLPDKPELDDAVYEDEPAVALPPVTVRPKRQRVQAAHPSGAVGPTWG